MSCGDLNTEQWQMVQLTVTRKQASLILRILFKLVIVHKGGKNLTEAELETIVENVQANRAIIFGSFTSKITSATKDDIWKRHYHKGEFLQYST